MQLREKKYLSTEKPSSTLFLKSTSPAQSAIAIEYHGDFAFLFSWQHFFRFKSRKAVPYKIKLLAVNSYPNGGDGARVPLGSVFLENIVALRPLVPL